MRLYICFHVENAQNPSIYGRICRFPDQHNNEMVKASNLAFTMCPRYVASAGAGDGAVRAPVRRRTMRPPMRWPAGQCDRFKNK